MVVDVAARLLGEIYGVVISVDGGAGIVGDIDQGPCRVVNGHIIKTTNIVRKPTINSNEANIEYIDMSISCNLNKHAKRSSSNCGAINLEAFGLKPIITIIDKSSISDMRG